MERKLSKKMPSNSRPPLTSRIRASFENKRTKSDIQSPTNPVGFITQQQAPETLHNAVQEVMNSEAFQNAIAANLAKILKPTIKDALDTIQPVVETVYNHEMLLRKTNRSVENLLEIVTEGTEADSVSMRRPTTPSPRKRAVSSFAGPTSIGDIKQLFEENNAQMSAKFQEMYDLVETSNGKTKEGLDSIATGGIQAQLDQLKADLGTVLTAIVSDLGTNIDAISERAPAHDPAVLSEHSTKLDAISTHLEGLKGVSGSAGIDHTEALQSIASSLEALKENVQAGITSSNESFGAITPQIGTILTTVEAQGATLELGLGEIQQYTTGAGVTPTSSDPEVATSLQTLKDELISLKDSIGAGVSDAGNSTNLEPQIATILAILDTHTATFEEIKESHAAHASALDGMKSGGSNESGESSILEPQIVTILAALESHTATLGELKDSHASHATALDGLKSLGASESGEPTNTEPQIAAIIATLESHTAALDEIKESHTAHANALDGIKSVGGIETGEAVTLEPQISAMIATLDTHTATLAAIQETHTAHSTALEGITSRGGGEVGVADESASLRPQIEALVATLDSHTATLGAIQESHAAHSSTLDEIKSLGLVASGEAGDSNTLEPKISAIIATLEGHTAALVTLQDSHIVHTTALEGLKLSNGVSATTSDLAALEPQIAAIIATQEAHTATLGGLQESHNSHATAIEEIKSTDSAPVDTSGIETQIAAVITTLESHTATLAGLQDSHTSHAVALGSVRSIEAVSTTGNEGSISSFEPQITTIITTLESHTAALEHLKSSGGQSVSEGAIIPAIVNLEGVESKIAAITTTLDSHTTLLNEIKDDVSAEILTVLQDLSGAHASNATVLSELREADASEVILTALHASNDSHISHSTALADLQAAVQSSNESHVLHAGVLDEIKSTRSIEPLTAGVPSSSEELGTIISALEEHKAILAEVKEAINSANDLHASQLTTLTELKANQPSGDAADHSGLEAHILNIISTLEAQSASLSDIKEASTSPEILAAVAETRELLQSHTALLDTIKDGNAHADILDNISSLKDMVAESRASIDEHGFAVKELHESSKGSHSEITEALTALAVGGAAGAGAAILATSGDDNSVQLLEEVKAVRAIVEKSSEIATSMAAQIDTNHTTVITTVTTLHNELQAEIDASGDGITTAITALSVDVTSIDLNSMSAAVSECGREINGFSAKLDMIDEGVRGTSTHIEGLTDGFHLSEKGVSQLKENSVSAGVSTAIIADAIDVPGEDAPGSEADAPRDLESVESETVQEAQIIIVEESTTALVEEEVAAAGLEEPVVNEDASIAESNPDETVVEQQETKLEAEEEVLPAAVEEAEIEAPISEPEPANDEEAVIEEPDTRSVEEVVQEGDQSEEQEVSPDPISEVDGALDVSEQVIEPEEAAISEPSDEQEPANVDEETIQEIVEDCPLPDVEIEEAAILEPNDEQEPASIDEETIQEIAEDAPLPDVEPEVVVSEPAGDDEETVPKIVNETLLSTEETVPDISEPEASVNQDSIIEEQEPEPEASSEAEETPVSVEEPSNEEPEPELEPEASIEAEETPVSVEGDVEPLESEPSEAVEGEEHVEGAPIKAVDDLEQSTNEERSVEEEAPSSDEHELTHIGIPYVGDQGAASNVPKEETLTSFDQEPILEGQEFASNADEGGLQAPESSDEQEQEPAAEEVVAAGELAIEEYSVLGNPIQDNSTGIEQPIYSDDAVLHRHTGFEHVETQEFPSHDDGPGIRYSARFAGEVEETYSVIKEDPIQENRFQDETLRLVDDVISDYQPIEDQLSHSSVISPLEATPTESDYGDMPSVHDSGSHVDGHALDEDIIDDEPEPEPYIQGERNSRFDEPEPNFQGERNNRFDEPEPTPYFQGERNSRYDEPEPTPYFQGERNSRYDEPEPTPYFQGERNSRYDEPEPTPYFQGERNSRYDEPEPTSYFQGERNSRYDESEPEPEPYFQGEQKTYYEDPADIAAREEMAAMNAEFARVAAEEEHGYGIEAQGDEVRTEASSPFITYPPSPTGTVVPNFPGPSRRMVEDAMDEPLLSPANEDLLSPIDTESPMSATFPGKPKRKKSKKVKKTRDEEDNSGESASVSASTSAITSPMSPDFPENAAVPKKKKARKPRNLDN